MSRTGSPTSTPLTKIFISPRVVRLNRRASASLSLSLSSADLCFSSPKTRRVPASDMAQAGAVEGIVVFGLRNPSVDSLGTGVAAVRDQLGNRSISPLIHLNTQMFQRASEDRDG